MADGFDQLTREDRLALAKIAEEIARRHVFRFKDQFQPYQKQELFFEAGATFRERLLTAGNQLGKTMAGSYEMACHLTGEYPDWWKGRRWERPVRCWAAGETGVATRDTVQKLLFGEPGDEEKLGTGMVPLENIGKTTLARGVANAYDTVFVRHKNGGQSVIKFKTYDQGREKWQGETLDIIWYDEEPPLELYTEGLTRTNATGGMIWMTFTPLKGMSSVYKRFNENVKDRWRITMTIDDVGHYSEEKKAQIIASYEEYEREARVSGAPMLGEGRVWMVPEKNFVIPGFEIPDHWALIAGCDFGVDHPTAGAWLAWDRDNDVIYVTDCYRQKGANTATHASAFKGRGEKIPVSWPHDGHSRDKGSGEPLAAQWRKEKVAMLPQHAQFEDGSMSVEAGVAEINDRLTTGRFKVFSHLADWLEEYRHYHRKDGLIVKEMDDILSATRYAVMMRRYAKLASDVRRQGKRGARLAAGLDFDVYS